MLRSCNSFVMYVKYLSNELLKITTNVNDNSGFILHIYFFFYYYSYMNTSQHSPQHYIG